MGRAERNLFLFGLAVTLAVIATSFMHTWHFYAQFARHPAEALGVAAGLELATLFFAFAFVYTRSRLAKGASVANTLIVWFANLMNMLRERGAYPAPSVDGALVATTFLASLYIPVSAILGAFVLAQLLRRGGEGGDPLPSPPRFVTPEEAAAALGIDPRALLADARSGRLNAVARKAVDGHWRWNLDELREHYRGVGTLEPPAP